MSFFSPKFILYSVVGFFIFLVLVIFYVFNSQSSTILNDDLSEGLSVDMMQNKIEFDLDGKKENLNLDVVENNSVTISFADSEDSFEIGEEKEIDLDGDGTDDISIRLESITDSIPRFYFKKLEQKMQEKINNSNSSFEEDSSFIQEENKNEIGEELVGVVNNFSQENESLEDNIVFVENSLIVENDSSTENIIENDSLNEDISEIVGLGCKGDLNCEDCGDNIDCFIENAEQCSYVSFEYFTSANFFGVVQNTTTYYELRGFEGDKCLLYNKYLDVSGAYGEELVNVSLENGMSQEEIDEANNELNNNFDELIEGKDSLCKYPVAELVEMIVGWKEGSVSGSSEDVEKYECIGSFYEA